ncbi:NFACT RNA binding domain-containing protein [Natronogracilivirga saccharolytica]|uniref:DUF814 domain-containing protein n=1 Tax=Natronogracilivirga saccharolytica TaxID=2812953 RepID=A0A8J7RK85_9BACT|nr:NFACT RNA binding domain-containing protein [Natronogracilivirga saccharolytica]MBP3192345.1 DUF814 domain-containing protein [Natronogracilivirga saccharolytica]
MNNFYTLNSLAAELRYKISDKEITEVISFQKDRIDFFLSPEETGKLSFVASSPGTALFLDSRTGKPMRNAASFFPEISGLTVKTIEMMSDADRLISVSFKSGPYHLIFKPFSSRPNVFLVKDDIIISSFKDDAGMSGKPAPKPHPPVSESQPDALKPARSVKEKIITVDKRFPRGIITDVSDVFRLDECSDEQLINHIRDLQKKLYSPGQVSITAEGNISLLPPSCLSHPPEKTFDSVNDAVRALHIARNRDWRLLPRKNELVKKLRKRLQGLQKQEEQFSKEPERRKKADTLEHYGHLLMSRPDAAVPASEEKITIADWADNGNEIDVAVIPGMTLIDQAQRYYDKAASIRKEIAMSATKKKQLETQKKEISDRLEELEQLDHPSALEKWLKKNTDRLQQLGLAATGKKQEARPYRTVRAGNYEVWIGKSAKSNDEMLRMAHKEDIWMHVRGAAGSHVIVRNGGDQGWPDERTLLQAASFAAAYSRQSGSSLVPVMMAKRKHVRKPKGAQPGAATVTNERVELVTPSKPEMAGS